ncbi:hypothetical protein ACFQ60_22525 [Streptomyces zhihengii]|uniref:Uncharacterized protein n=1 Tax=Streptomyces zhihengii TaxID=1818004 RepID=A0ABS2UTV8_9ACTN|nr:hypothetical protein [Streptomyces zhihengii]MBM9621006.1 hypothetical protein [Streptomyces zhihengii]
MSRPPVYVRGLRLYMPHGAVLEGLVWPDGRCLLSEDPLYGLTVGAPTAEDLARGFAGARVEWATPAGPALQQLVEQWAAQPDRYAALQELMTALTDDMTPSGDPT